MRLCHHRCQAPVVTLPGGKPPIQGRCEPGGDRRWRLVATARLWVCHTRCQAPGVTLRAGSAVLRWVVPRGSLWRVRAERYDLRRRHVPFVTTLEDSTMATLHPSRAADEGRRDAHRVRRAGRSVYSCRYCWESIRVTDADALPESCPACAASTWEDDGRCSAWIQCDAVRRPDESNGTCHGCGNSIWTPVEVSTRASLRS
jgi:hypothetical protein